MTADPHTYRRYKAGYERNKRAQIAAGTWQPWADAGPVREHVLTLCRMGLGYTSVAKLAGVSGTPVGRLLYADPPRVRIQTEVARRILAVNIAAAPAALDDRQSIPAAGVHRRIQALAVAGYNLATQAAALGRTRPNYHTLLNRATVSVGTWKAVAGLYARWSETSAPDSLDARRSRSFAAGKYWLPAAAWDDDSIDDPTATPCVLPPVAGSDPAVDELAVATAYLYTDYPIQPAVRDEIVRRMAAASYTNAEIGPKVRMHPTSIGEIKGRLRITRERWTPAAAVPLADTDERDDLHGGDLRPWTSRAAWAEEMFDGWAA